MSPRAKAKSSALFLGAGASAAFGYPLTGDILPHIRAGLNDGTLFPLESNPKRERGKMKRLRGHLGTLLPAFFEDDIELPLITDVLSLIDLLLTTGEIAVPMLSTEEMEDLRTLLEEAIIHSIESADTGQRGAQLDRLTDWVLNAADGGAALTVVSTNYDTVVESLVFEKIDVDPELEISSAVDMGFSWREHSSGNYIEAVNQPPPSPRVRLFKLHGSVSWLKCPLCGFIYINTVGSIVQQAFREDKIDYNNTCVCGHGPVRPVIVAPSMVRTIKDPDLLTIWRSALEAMRVADEWIIVGYSLPPEDIAIRSILVRAHSGRGRKRKPPTIRVVQRTKDEKLEGRYRLLFPESKFEYGGFEAFIETLPKPSKHFPVF
jgi:NAD-dependent SIR2 family protein deacetylase